MTWEAQDLRMTCFPSFYVISHCDLVEIPEGIVELQHITVLRKDTVIAASLQLYLFANQLQSLSPTLFQLKNLTVLSLRKYKVLST